MTTAVLEIRTYRLHPGCLTAFDETMRTASLPLLRRFDIDVVHAAPSESPEDGSTDYVLIRSYPTHEERDRLEAAFYSSTEWKAGPAAAILGAIESYHTITMTVDIATLDALRWDGASRP
ncbi:MAG TPA: hypothetical protein VIG48_10815 [Jatrophihabitans sp.]|jgi:hypothetical protein